LARGEGPVTRGGVLLGGDPKKGEGVHQQKINRQKTEMSVERDGTGRAVKRP